MMPLTRSDTISRNETVRQNCYSAAFRDASRSISACTAALD